MLPALRDPRYLRVDYRPLFAVYRPTQLPDSKAFCDLRRELAERAGLPGLHLVGFGHRRWNPTRHGFDASVVHGFRLPGLRRRTRGWRKRLRALRGRPIVYSYRRFVERGLPEAASPLDYPVALSNWDNTPRAGERGIVLEGGTPELFRRQLREALERVASRPSEQRIVFLKSWNEWAEGNYVEPDQQFGTSCLEVIRDEITRASAR